MKKEIKKYGDSLVITFTAEEKRIYNIKEGMIADIDDIVFYEKKGEPIKEGVFSDSHLCNKQKSEKIKK